MGTRVSPTNPHQLTDEEMQLHLIQLIVSCVRALPQAPHEVCCFAAWGMYGDWLEQTALKTVNQPPYVGTETNELCVSAWKEGETVTFCGSLWLVLVNTTEALNPDADQHAILAVNVLVLTPAG